MTKCLSYFSPQTLTILLLTGLGLSGCSSAPREVEPNRAASTSPAAAPSAANTPVSAVAVGHGGAAPASSVDSAPSTQGEGKNEGGGIKWTPAKRWKRGPEREMRAATYLIPAAGGDSEGAECAVFYFGPGQGGAVDANITRWIGQFEQPDGKPSEQAAKKKTETINGLSVTTVDLTGTYLGGGPTMGQGGGKKAGYRLLGAIVAGPQGPIFFKLTGPAKTVAAAQEEFQAMLKSLALA